MSLLEKVNQEKKERQNQASLPELLEETNELNKLMKSYITVQMDREGVKSQNLTKELQAIEKISEKTQEEMLLIMKRQETQSHNQREQMRNLLNDYLNQMQERDDLSAKKLEQLNAQIVQNTQKGLELVHQNNADLHVKIKKEVDQTLENLTKKVNNLSANFKFAERRTFVELVLPTALVASLFAVALFLLIQYFLT